MTCQLLFFLSVIVSSSFLFGLILIKATTKTSQTSIDVMESDYTSTLPCIGQWWAGNIFIFRKVIKDKSKFHLGMEMI